MSAHDSRVLLLLSQAFSDGGIQRFNRTLIAASAMTDPRVDVMTLRDPPDRVSAGEAQGVGTVTGFDNDRIRFALATFRALLSGRYRLIVVGHVNLLVMTMILRRLVPHHPNIWMIAHGQEVWCRMGLIKAAAIRGLDRALAVSRFTRDSILSQVPDLSPARITLFPNALATGWHDLDRSSIDVALNLPARFFLAVSRLEVPDRTKGILCTIEALAMTADSSLHLVVAGDGSDLGFIRRAAARVGAADRVTFLGRVSDEVLKCLYSRCLAFVLPSGQEGFGIVYLEAAFFGAPVVGARAKGVVDVIEDSHTGLLVDYGDRVGLSRVLDRLATDDQLRTRLRDAARAQVTAGGRFTFCAYRYRWQTLLQQAGVEINSADLA